MVPRISEGRRKAEVSKLGMGKKTNNPSWSTISFGTLLWSISPWELLYMIPPEWFCICSIQRFVLLRENLSLTGTTSNWEVFGLMVWPQIYLPKALSISGCLPTWPKMQLQSFRVPPLRPPMASRAWLRAARAWRAWAPPAAGALVAAAWLPPKGARHGVRRWCSAEEKPQLFPEIDARETGKMITMDKTQSLYYEVWREWEFVVSSGKRQRKDGEIFTWEGMNASLSCLQKPWPDSQTRKPSCRNDLDVRFSI